MSNKKILHLAKWYPNKENPLLGIFVRKQIQSIQNSYENKVISLFETDKMDTSINRVNSRFENIQEVTYYYKRGRLNKLKVFYFIWKEIKNSKSDWIHAHIISWASTLAFLAKKTTKTPYVISEHWSGYHTGLFKNQTWIIKKLKRFIASKATKLAVVSSYLKMDMLASGIKANYTVVGNVVEGKPENLEKNEQFTFIFVGDLEQSHKNSIGIITSFGSALKSTKNIQLDIIGDGTDKEKCIKLCESLNLTAHVNFRGSLSNKDVFKALSKSHVLILNSFYETFSIICAEALLCGIPVISTRCGGPEMFLNERTGILIDTDNNKQLTDAMLLIQKKYENYKSDELKKVAAQFDRNKIGEEIKRLYELI